VLRTDVLKSLAKGRQARTLVVVDACFSGQTPDGKAPLVPSMQATVPVRRVELAKGMERLTVLSSSTSVSGPLPGRHRPAFSALLLGAFRGWADGDGDASVSVDDAFGYVDVKLTNLVRDRSQRPSKYGPSWLPPTQKNRPRRSPKWSPRPKHRWHPLLRP
jgi:hypothetical protein